MTITREMLEEAVLNFSQRRKRALTLRKFAAKVQIARQRALKRMASTDSIESRAHRAAIRIVRKIVAGQMGLDYNTLSVSQKMAIDTKVQTKQKLTARLTQKLVPKMRKAEIDRFRSLHINEASGAGEEGTIELVNKYASETPGQDDPFLPGLQLDKKYYFERYGDIAPMVMATVKMKTSERARKTDDS
jgi:hypothetical protein